jgi:hypothetical protein
MTSSAVRDSAATPLRLGIVLASGEDTCTVQTGGQTTRLPYAAAFPRPRAERVLPGHLVAIAALPGVGDAVVWRWFDAVVLDQVDDRVRLWEPGHGEVVAQARDSDRPFPPGSRAYASAGLEGADWWVSGPVVHQAEDADVELAEVQRFLTLHGLLATTP